MSLVLSLSTVVFNFRGFPCQSRVRYLSCLRSWPVCSCGTSPGLAGTGLAEMHMTRWMFPCYWNAPSSGWKKMNEYKWNEQHCHKAPLESSPSNGGKNWVAEERLVLAHCAEWWGVFYLWNCFLIPTNARNPFREKKKKPYVKNSNPVISLKEKNMCMS